MHCGFAMLSVGCVRARFSKHICILILLDACASAIGFFLVREEERDFDQNSINLSVGVFFCSTTLFSSFFSLFFPPSLKPL